MKRYHAIILLLMMTSAVMAKPIDPTRVTHPDLLAQPGEVMLPSVPGVDHVRRISSDLGGSNQALLSPRGLLILVNYSDQQMTTITHAEADSMMNGQHYTYGGAPGSARQYFIDQSDGQYAPQFTVVGPYTLSREHDYYGDLDSINQRQDQYLGDLVIDACRAADADVDFRQFDYDKDGYVDFVYILYAGTGEADSGDKTDIWPNSGSLSSLLYYGYSSQNTYTYSNPLRLDGKVIDKYACSNEICYSTRDRDGLGTILHEYSHVIGLPDIYDATYGTNYYQGLTPGSWSLMDAGSYNNRGITPPNYAAWDKYFCGWITPTRLTQAADVLLAPGEAVMLSASWAKPQYYTTSTVYYLENRQRSGWDAYLPGHGLVVWQVTYNERAWIYNQVNTSDIRYGLYGNMCYPTMGMKKCTAIEPIEGHPITHIQEDADGNVLFRYKGGDGSLIDVCEDYNWVAKKALTSGANLLGDLQWTVAMDGSEVLGYNAFWGAVFGSTQEPATAVTLTTVELQSCQPSSFRINARGEGALLSLSIGGHSLGTFTLASSSKEYTFLNPNKHSGEVILTITQSGSVELDLKSIRIGYEELTGLPEVIDPADVTGTKILHEGRIYLERGGIYYDIMGRRL